MKLVVVAWVLASCASQSSWNFTDGKGRACVRRVDNSVTCNVPPQPSIIGCYTDAPNACFALVYNQTAFGVREQLCDACCATDGDAGPLYQITDCTDVVCKVDSDCVVMGAICSNAGTCIRN